MFVHRASGASRFLTKSFDADTRYAYVQQPSAKRVIKVVAGRKAGALTLQPPEYVPVRFVRIPAPASAPAAVIA
ncbi:hypothetical protein BKA62DRAFT_771738 [Auriculariales sp. MPI-PUGE-AT-0066]|nr:hypothetical protein BKA62DRAFT_771738 [Auriculariales sp. MPI-PUGE-AT-0066]